MFTQLSGICLRTTGTKARRDAHATDALCDTLGDVVAVGREEEQTTWEARGRKRPCEAAAGTDVQCEGQRRTRSSRRRFAEMGDPDTCSLSAHEATPPKVD